MLLRATFANLAFALLQLGRYFFYEMYLIVY